MNIKKQTVINTHTFYKHDHTSHTCFYYSTKEGFKMKTKSGYSYSLSAGDFFLNENLFNKIKLFKLEVLKQLPDYEKEYILKNESDLLHFKIAKDSLATLKKQARNRVLKETQFQGCVTALKRMNIV